MSIMKAVMSFRAATYVLSLLSFGLSLASGQTSNTCVSPLDSDNYSKFTIVEFAEYTQTNADGAFPIDSNSFAFEAVISLATNMTATAATVSIPDIGPQMMRTTDFRTFSYFVITNSFSNLAAAYPGGDYTFIISNNQTLVTWPEGATLPNAPTLTNYAATQTIDATKDFTLSWVPFSGGSPQDYIDVQLSDQFGEKVFKSGEFECPDSLDGTASSVLIPANTLVTNQTYDTEIDFIKVYLLNTNSPPVALLAGTEAVTLTSVSTSAAGVAPLILSNAALVPGGGIQFDLATTPGVTTLFNSTIISAIPWVGRPC